MRVGSHQPTGDSFMVVPWLCACARALFYLPRPIRYKLDSPLYNLELFGV